jgi:hypothetical protein
MRPKMLIELESTVDGLGFLVKSATEVLIRLPPASMLQCLEVEKSEGKETISA